MILALVFNLYLFYVRWVVSDNTLTILHDLNKETILYDLNKETILYDLNKESILYDLNKESILYDPNKETILYDPIKETILYDPNKETISYDPNKENVKPILSRLVSLSLIWIYFCLFLIWPEHTCIHTPSKGGVTSSANQVHAPHVHISAWGLIIFTDKPGRIDVPTGLVTIPLIHYLNYLFLYLRRCIICV